MSTPAYGTPYTPRYGAGPDPALSDEAMRDRQARGKDPYREDDEMPDAVVEEDEDHVAATISDAQARLRTGRGESFEEREKKEFAMAVLDDPELLLMHAQAQGDSVAGQRLRFLRMLCPIEQEKDRQGRRPTRPGSASASGATASPRNRRQFG